jgi:hypothetical protein
MGYMLVAKTRTTCKLYTNNQWMKVYMLNVYIIHMKYVHNMSNHHLWLNVRCDFTFATNKLVVTNVHYNLFILANYNHKLAFLF